MDRERGLMALTRRGWLSATPVEFQRAILSNCGWKHVEAGAPIIIGGDDTEDLFGVARGTVGVTTIFGAPDTPVMHLAHAVVWMGYGPLMSSKFRRVTANARTPAWMATLPLTTVRRLLDGRPEWWRYFMPLALEYGDHAASSAADLLIRSSERRCAAVLLRLSGCRFVDRARVAPFEITLTQDELAAAANLSRNTAGTVLRKLASRGLIKLDYGSITVRAPSALRALIDGV